MKTQLHVRMSILLLLLIFIFGPFAFSQETEHLKKGVVKIQVVTFEGTRKAGTGFIIKQDEESLYILTASHIVEGAREIQIEFYTLRNRHIPAKALKMEGGDPKGLAILEVTERIPADVSALSVSSSVSLHENDPVTIVGFPRIAGIEWAVTTGIIAGRMARDITFSGTIEEGHSGSPLVKDGKVVGIVTQKRGEFALAIPAIIAEYVLESWGIQAEALGEIQRSRQAVHNLVVNGNFREHWNIGWRKHVSSGDQERGSLVEISIDNQQLQFKGCCNFCAISQSIPIDGLRGLNLEISFRIKACLGTEEDCRRGLEGLRYLNSYDLAGLQIEYQDENEEPLGIIRFIDTTSGSVVGAGLVGTIKAPETGDTKWKAIKIDDKWQILKLDLYEEALKTFSFIPEQVKHILIAFFNSHTGEDDGFGEITVDSVKLYYD